MSLQIKGDVISSSSVVAEKNLRIDLAAPVMVAFDITNKCNFRCLHCFNHSGENIFQDELTNDQKLAVAKQIVELNPYLVCLCGGETTCCEVLSNILRILKDTVPTINIVSNGYLMTEKLALELKNSGVSAVQISLDGINAEQHDTFRGHKGAFEHAVNAIRILHDCGINVLTSLVPNKLNYKDAYSYFKLCHSLHVRGARSMPYLPMGRGGDIGSKLILNDEEYYIFIQQLIQAKKDFPEMNVEWGDPIDHTYRMPENARNGCNSYSMDVRSNGDICVSAYFPIIVGNCKRHTLKEYWEHGYSNIWQDQNIVKMMNEISNITDFAKIKDFKEYRIDLMG